MKMMSGITTKTTFILWIVTIVFASLLLITQAPNWNWVGFGFFTTDVLLGIYLFCRFVLKITQYYHKKFGQTKASIFSVLSISISLVGGITLLFGIVMVSAKYFTPQTTTKNVPQASLSIPTTILVKERLITDEIQIGSWGEDVSLLQLLLSQDKTMYSGPVSGYFGMMTKDALIRFQQKYDLEQTGKTDISTRNAIDQIYSNNTRKHWVRLIPTISISAETINNQTEGSGEWGKSTRIEGTEHGWTMRVGLDPNMATAEEIFQALNTYRNNKGTHGLNWDNKLASFAQDRANYLNSIGSTDDHAGFRSYISNIDNRMRLGFKGLGENASSGFRLNGTHIIEWMYAGDAPHENLQLDSSWTDVGVGVSGTATSIIFGYDRF